MFMTHFVSRLQILNTFKVQGKNNIIKYENEYIF